MADRPIGCESCELHAARRCRCARIEALRELASSRNWITAAGIGTATTMVVFIGAVLSGSRQTDVDEAMIVVAAMLLVTIGAAVIGVLQYVGARRLAKATNALGELPVARLMAVSSATECASASLHGVDLCVCARARAATDLESSRTFRAIGGALLWTLPVTFVYGVGHDVLFDLFCVQFVVGAICQAIGDRRRQRSDRTLKAFAAAFELPVARVLPRPAEMHGHP